mmetsp:Transcript_4599/g.8953  ORF Transcript_4599/g.8953 Transcript_4599/m.8953 type:complete len:97 (+) Transcript_4599:55-345(+)
MSLLRYQKVATSITLFLSVWYYFGKDITKSPSSSRTTVDVIILHAPILALFSLAIYAVVSVAVGVVTFSNCPEAAAELENQIVEARRELKKKGFSF